MNKILKFLMLIVTLLILGNNTDKDIQLSDKIKFEGYKIYNTMNTNSNLDETIISTSEIVKIEVNSKSDFQYNLGNYYDIKESEVNAIKSKRIKAGAVYYSELNKNTFNQLPNYDYKNIYLSKYFPIISFDVSSEKLIKDQYQILNEIAEIKDVEKIVVKANKEKQYDTFNDDAMGIMEVLDEVENGTLSGNGVKIGILDSGIVDKDNEMFEGKSLTIRNHLLYIESVGDHATGMAALAAGRYGVARNASIYSVEAFNNLAGELDWLIDHEVDVINISIGNGNTGIYDSESAKVDHTIYTYGITICVASGNTTGEDNSMICNPAIAFNAVSVGTAINQYYAHASYCYNTVTQVDKPTLVTPGVNVLVPNVPECSGTGSSLATALTTGTVALLMELDPTLKLYPQKVLALLTANTYYMTKHYSYDELSWLDSYVGAGCTNFLNCKNNINNCVAATYNGQGTINQIFGTFGNIYLTAGQTIRVSAAWLAKSTGTVSSLNANDFDATLAWPRGGQVETTAGTYNNIDMFVYDVELTGNHTIRIQTANTLTNQGNETVFVCWNITDQE